MLALIDRTMKTYKFELFSQKNNKKQTIQTKQSNNKWSVL